MGANHADKMWRRTHKVNLRGQKWPLSGTVKGTEAALAGACGLKFRKETDGLCWSAPTGIQQPPDDEAREYQPRDEKHEEAVNDQIRAWINECHVALRRTIRVRRTGPRGPDQHEATTRRRLHPRVSPCVCCIHQSEC